MIPRKLRLTRAHFAPSGPEKRLVSSHFSLSIREKQDHGGCAVVVSKKVSKLSVGRHLLKRRVLSVLKPWCLPSRALIVYARPGSQTLPFPVLKEELEELLTRAFPEVR
ncbi:MAG: ribonuclease P protein component [Patescibacteria group bacterium]